MSTTWRFLPLITITVLLRFPSPASAIDPVTTFAAGYLASKVVDVGWDQATGKPDIRKIAESLSKLELDATLNSDMRREVEKLRERINESVTRDEFLKMVKQTTEKLKSIQERLDSLEERVEKLEVEKDDIKSGTDNASSARFWISRAGELLSKKKHKRALASYRIALNINYGMEAAHKGRCKVYRQEEAWGALIAAATDAVASVKECDELYFVRERVFAHAALQDNAEALEDCSKIIAVKPTDWEIRKIRAMNARTFAHSLAFASLFVGGEKQAKQRNDCIQMAIDDYSAIIGNRPKSAAAYYDRSKIYSDIRSFSKNPTALEQEISDLSSAIRLDPGNAEYLLSRAGIYRNLEPRRYDLAIADLTAAIAIEPRNPNLLGHRAECYYGIRKTDDAIADAEAVLKLDAESGSSILKTIYTYYRRDDNKAKYYREMNDRLRHERYKRETISK